MVILALATAAYTWVVSFVVDKAAGLEDGKEAVSVARSYGLAILPVLIGIPFISGVSNYAQRILANSIALNAVGDMQKQMLAASHETDYANFSSSSIGSRISKFVSDVSVISASLIRVLSNLIRDLLTVIFTIIAMLWQNWMLSLAMVIFVLAILPIISISQKMRGSAKEVQEHVGVITSELKESFGGFRMVKTYRLEDHEKKRLGKSFDERIRLYLKLVTQQARVDPILEVLGGLVIAAVLVFGVYQINADLATPGSIGAVLTGIMILSPKLRALGTLNNVIQEGLSSLTRIFDVIDEKPAILDRENAINLSDPRGDISFDDVSFSYPDGTEALRAVSLSAKSGETVALVGPSGGGKSTIINLIPRLYDVSTGQVTIDGHDVRDVSLESLRHAVALVSQDVTLFDETVADNIGFGDLSAARDDIIAAAKAADAHDFIMQLPNGYETRVGEDGDNLSGGQKQRISIARAILRDAPVLLLDEATSALDAESEAKVQAAMERLALGRTTIVIAHRLSTVQNADRIYVLDEGRLVESGTHKSLSRKKNGLYARLRKLQFG